MMFVFLAYLTGYFLQTFPVGCLFLSAFPDEKLCMERRRAVSIYAALTAGLSLLLSGISVWILLNGRMVNAGLGSLLLNLGIVLIVICLWQMLQRGTKGRAAALLFTVHYEAVIVAVNTVLMELPFAPVWPASYGFTETLAYTPAAPFGLFLLTAVSWVPARLFFRRYLGEFVGTMSETDVRRASLCVAAAIGTTMLGTSFFVFSAPRYTLLFLILSLLCNSITYYLFFRELREVRRAEALSRHIELMELQYRQISSHIEEMRRLRHDVRHHLRTLSVLNRAHQTEEIAAYLDAYEAQYRSADSLPLCGYMPVDSMLNYYAAKAAERGIAFRVRNGLHGSYAFPAVDMTVLLGNVLENALEACAGSKAAEEGVSAETGKRSAGAENTARKSSGGVALTAEAEPPRIEVDLQALDASFLLRISNTAEETALADAEFHEFVPQASTKGPERGRGLSSAAEIAAKYGGVLEIKRERRTFSLRVLLHVPEGTGRRL